MPNRARPTPPWLWGLFVVSILIALFGGLWARSFPGPLSLPVGLPLFFVGVAGLVVFAGLRGRVGK